MNTTLPQTGEVFDLRYHIVCRLGIGPDGYVFGATELDTGKRVAIKCWIGPHAQHALAASQQFVRTAHEVRLFDNPHIAEVFAAEAGRTVNYCVMDWLEGMTLARRIARRRPSPLSDVFNIVVPCTRAVAEAHAAGLIHGDVRPGHIFVCRATKHRQAIARIFDFGRDRAGQERAPEVARAANAEAYQYATPEQLQGAPLDARSDIYAFGIMLFEMLAGERPFFADTPAELARKITDGEAKLLASISPSIPSRLANVVERAMAVDPEQRYPTLVELIDALAPFDPTGSRVYVTLPSPPRAASTALELRGSPSPHARAARATPPLPTIPRDVNRTPVVADITTTSASWELTEPIAFSRYSYELLGRITWQRAAVWCAVILTAITAARYLQPVAAPEAQQPAAYAPEAAQYAEPPPPNSGFDPITCRNGFGMIDPSCAPPLRPTPEVFKPIVAPPPALKPRAAYPTPRGSLSAPAVSPPRATPSAAANSRRSHSASTPARSNSAPAPVKPKKQIEPAPRRTRSPDDPFVPLDNMRLQ